MTGILNSLSRTILAGFALLAAILLIFANQGCSGFSRVVAVFTALASCPLWGDVARFAVVLQCGANSLDAPDSR
jgi:hypothetical protein